MRGAAGTCPPFVNPGPAVAGPLAPDDCMCKPLEIAEPSARIHYDPFDAYVQDDLWHGIDMLYFGGTLVGHRVATAKQGEPIDAVFVNLPRSDVDMQFTREEHGDDFLSLAVNLTDTVIRALYSKRAAA